MIREYQETEFENYAEGDKGALLNIMELERDTLYDYVFRMTAQDEFANSTIDEVTNILCGSNSSASFLSLDEFRIVLYTTARSFSGDRWNADITKLIVPEFDRELTALVDAKKIDKDKLLNFISFLASMPPPQREILLLQYRFGFYVVDIVRIMSITEQTASELVKDSWQAIKEHMGEDFSKEDLPEYIKWMPKYLGVESDTMMQMQETAAFSHVIKGVLDSKKEAKRNRTSGKPYRKKTIKSN